MSGKGSRVPDTWCAVRFWRRMDGLKETSLRILYSQIRGEQEERDTLVWSKGRMADVIPGLRSSVWRPEAPEAARHRESHMSVGVLLEGPQPLSGSKGLQAPEVVAFLVQKGHGALRCRSHLQGSFASQARPAISSSHFLSQTFNQVVWPATAWVEA